MCVVRTSESLAGSNDAIAWSRPPKESQSIRSFILPTVSRSLSVGKRRSVR